MPRTILTWTPMRYGISRGYLYGAGLELHEAGITQREARERYEDEHTAVVYDRDGLCRRVSETDTRSVGEALTEAMEQDSHEL